MNEPTLYELSRPGRSGVVPPRADVPAAVLPPELLREDNAMPELSELDVVRHFVHLSQRNYGVDSGFYPLGSCTMKYNPKAIDECARLEGFASTHPLRSESDVQGNLQILSELQAWLAEIGGFAQVSLAPTAGAQGELAALLMIRAYHRSRGETQRRQILIPDSAHGTNPASTSMAGYEVTEVPSDANGNIDLAALRAACDDTVAALMITNPNTLGLFEQQIENVTRCVHDCGGVVYGDGANMNALAAVARPAALGIDLMHYNLHKTFATPHGGGGPGAGPLGASTALAEFLPGPIAVSEEAGGERRYRLVKPKQSIGRMSTFAGNFGTCVRAYAYLLMQGSEGLRRNALHAVLNANYLRVKIRETYCVPFDRINMHELVCEGRVEGTPVRALDISKRLMDFGFHPPTNYFPLTVADALMIEPTETESKETLDAFAAALIAIARESREEPETVLSAPHETPVGRLDEAKAARALVLTGYARGLPGI